MATRAGRSMAGGVYSVARCLFCGTVWPMWTTDPPTEPGWYWLHTYGAAEPVHVSDGRVTTFWDEGHLPAPIKDALWYSEPITPPEGPE